MSFDVSKILSPEVAKLGLEVLGAVASVIDPAAGVTVETAVTVIRAMIGQFEKSVAGEVKPETVRSELAHWLGVLKENDAAADAALHKKFPGPAKEG